MTNIDILYYEKLVKERKNTTSATIYVNNVKLQKACNFIGESALSHATINDPMLLIVECSRQSSLNFGFKLLAKHFDEQSFFRFESSGTTHHNRYADIPLARQQVITPHFHGFDAKGRRVAYHTTELDAAISDGTIKNVQKAFSIFCHETNVRHNDTVIPQVISTPCGELNLTIEREDPLENIIFV